MSDATRRRTRVESLTGLRWFAALFVFLHHVVNLAPMSALSVWSWLGVSGVTFFFVLSGFVLAWSWSPTDTAQRFYRRRFARIYPLYFLTTILALPVFYGTSQTWQKPVEIVPIVLAFVLLQGWFVRPLIFYAGNPASWSLSLEAFFYAIFPATIRPMMRKSLRSLLVVVIAAGAITWAVYAWTMSAHLSEEVAGFIVKSPPYRVLEFILGMCLGVAMRRGWRTPVNLGTAVGIFLVLAVGLVLWGQHANAHYYLSATNPMNQVLAPAYALIIAAAAQRDIDGRPSFLRNTALVALGQWSYAFYLIHETVIYSLRLAHGGVVVGVGDQLAAILLALGLSILAAWLLYRFVEHPLERRLRGARTPTPAHGLSTHGIDTPVAPMTRAESRP